MGHCLVYSVRVNMRRCACVEDNTVRSACAPDNHQTLDSLVPMWLPDVASGRSDYQNVAARFQKKNQVVKTLKNRAVTMNVQHDVNDECGVSPSLSVFFP